MRKTRILIALTIAMVAPTPSIGGIGVPTGAGSASRGDPLRLAWCQQMGGYATYEEYYRAQRAERERAKGTIREDQTALQQLGYYRGRIDGVSGGQMKVAVGEFRRTNGMSPGTTLDAESRRVLRSSDAKRKESGPDRKQVQQMLSDLGYYRGRADGIPGPRTRAALARFRQEHGLSPGGDSLDAHGMQVLQEAHSKRSARPTGTVTN